MNSKVFPGLLILSFVVLFACNGKQEKNTEQLKKVTVYGSSKCHHCTDFMKQLDSANITYEFKDLIQEEKEYDKEMLDKVEKSGYRGYVNIPVIEVGEEIFIRPDIKKVANLAKSN